MPLRKQGRRQPSSWRASVTRQPSQFPFTSSSPGRALKVVAQDCENGRTSSSTRTWRTKPPARPGRLIFRPGTKTIWPVDEEVPVIQRLKSYDWTFSASAEAVFGVLLALVLVACIFQ